MIHVLLDTNIYGLLIEDPNHIGLAHRIAGDRNLLIHNFRLIRNELRRIPKILPLYDRLVSRTVIQATREIDELAAKYFDQYKAESGRQGKKKMLNDFKIVACASLKRFDLIFTEDRKTMQHALAVKAYRTVNLRRNLRTPQFYSYRDLRSRYL